MENSKKKFFDWLLRKRLELFYRRNPAVIKFQFPGVSPVGTSNRWPKNPRTQAGDSSWFSSQFCIFNIFMDHQ